MLLLAAFFAWNIEVLAQTPPSPKQLKLDAISKLETKIEQISTTNRGLRRTLTKAIDQITRSLSDFLDEFRVADKKVFERELQAVERLLKAIKRNDTPQEIKSIFQEVIDALVEADRRITERSIATAQRLVQVGEGKRRKVAKAQREFKIALGTTSPRKAIERFKKAWETSQEVVEDRELVITTFDDAPDPFFPGVTTNTLSATFQIHIKGKRHKDDGRGNKRDRDDEDDDRDKRHGRNDDDDDDERDKRYGKRDDEGRGRYNRRDKDDDRDKKHRRGNKDNKDTNDDQLILEFIEIIQDFSGSIVRTLTTEHAVPGLSRKDKDRLVELNVTSVWDGRDEEGKIVRSGTYSYIAFGRIVRDKSDWRERRRGHRSDRRWHRSGQSRYGKGENKRQPKAISFPVVGSISVVQLGVAITSPLPGSVIDTSTVLVEGFIDALPGTEVGVVVNGVVAEVNQGEFAAFVPLQLGTNTITATVVDPTGNSASDSVTIDVSDLQEEPLRLLASPSSGLNPLIVELRALSLLDRPIVLFEYDFEGDGIVDVSSTTPDAVSHTYNQEGLFFPTLTVTDDLGNKTSATTIVNVFALPDLVAKWNAMKDALRIGDIDGALSFIAEESRERYQEVFTVISSQLSQIDLFLTDINLLTVEGNQAEFEMLRISSGVEVSFYVLFVRDNDGIWRIRTF